MNGSAHDAPRVAVLFGGTGFIGSHLACHLLTTGTADRVVLADLKPPEFAHRFLDERKIIYANVDVREPIDLECDRPALVVNLAAVHREPGHEANEYFETNVRGAENVTAFATRVGCRRLVFTSSISVYGPSEVPKDESSLPTPTTPYGTSKLVAEKIHETWNAASSDRQLVIVRPGVVFGPREGGNVSRLVQAVARGYFVFTGNQHVRKAGGYVKELCATITRALELEARALTYNFSATPPPRLDEFVSEIAKVAGVSMPTWSVPVKGLLLASHVAHNVSRVFGIKFPLHPVRVQKLTRSNNIHSARLNSLGYKPNFTLNAALGDWRHDLPSDWQ